MNGLASLLSMVAYLEMSSDHNYEVSPSFLNVGNKT